MNRKGGRKAGELRPTKVEVDYIEYPEGSVLLSMGKTRVLCNVSIEERVPAWMKRKELPGGWITAEYALLPRSTTSRVPRETDGLGGRTQEIRRLIGRSLRAGFDLTRLGERTCIVDCDVLQADGGTRTAAITGGYLALRLALQPLIAEGEVSSEVILPAVAAVSVGFLEGRALLDLCYLEDSSAEVDLNLVMNEEGKLIEVQGTAEGAPFSRGDLDLMLDLAAGGIGELFSLYRETLE
ncbi:MAG: ribonuclease PH [Anaerolineales bacterium]|nr:ribonuclease PH [Anaerolineales bacterium]